MFTKNTANFDHHDQVLLIVCEAIS